jgi:hypothetical protein
MTTIYVRIPRNRWTPIGTIDLYGWFVYGGIHDDDRWQPGKVVSKDPRIRIDPELLAAIEKTTELTREIHEYRTRHDVRCPHAESLVENREHVAHIRELERKRWSASVHRIIEKRTEAKAESTKKAKS